MLDSDNAGDGGCGLCTMEPMAPVAKVGVMAEGVGLGTREALSDMVLHQTSDGVAAAYQGMFKVSRKIDSLTCITWSI